MSRHNSPYMSDRDSLTELAAFAKRRDQEAEQEFAEWVEANKDAWAEEHGRTFTAEERRKAAKSGAALSDGSYPIFNQEDADNAARRIGTGNASKDTIIAHIRKRVKALGLKMPPVAQPAGA
jgi:hypothetical protein